MSLSEATLFVRAKTPGLNFSFPCFPATIFMKIALTFLLKLLCFLCVSCQFCRVFVFRVYLRF
jgi:hypothetical protein